MRQRFETKEDQTLYIDFSKLPTPDLRKIRDAPVSGLNLDDTRIPDLTPLKGLRLTSLSHRLHRFWTRLGCQHDRATLITECRPQLVSEILLILIRE